MGFLESVRSHVRPTSGVAAEVAEMPPPGAVDGMQDEENFAHQQNPVGETGVQAMEAAQAIWGKTGRWLVIVGLAMVMIIYELDNSTTYIYNNYSTSAFGALSTLSTLSTASTIVFAVVKPPVAKLSDVIGRGQTYLLTIAFYILSYILMASAQSIGVYAVGTIFHSIGQSGTNLMNDITVSDITSARWRGLGIGLSFFPFLVMPWVSAYIVDSVVGAGGIGWRWGIGMLAILMPFCASLIVTTLLYYQGRGAARSMGLAPPPRPRPRPRPRITTPTPYYAFCSQVDLGGVVLFSGGLALLLLPLTLAATSPARWRTPYLDALIALGGLMLLLLLPVYEKHVARCPVVPGRYFANRTIVLCLLLVATDSLGFACTHTYIYAWGSVARGFEARVDTFFTYVNGVTQCLVGILAGLAMGRLRRYKHLGVAGAVIRTVGYGVMLRLRGAANPAAELFVVQAVQGVGSGIMQTVLLVPAQISVPHGEMAQITALVVSVSFVGSSIGSCIAGGIYTNTLKPALRRHLGTSATDALVDSLFNSITGVVPAWGTAERSAVNSAFTDVMRYMTYAALGSSIPGLLMAALLPNHKLPDRNNLIEN